MKYFVQVNLYFNPSTEPQAQPYANNTDKLHLRYVIIYRTLYFISISVPCIFYYFALWTKKCTQLLHKLSHSYMFRHYSVILRQPVTNTLPSHTSISNAAVGNTVYN